MMIYIYIYMVEIQVKLGFQNKNKGSLGKILKMTNGNITNYICVFASQLQGSNMKMQESFIFEKAMVEQCAMTIIYQTRILSFELEDAHLGSRSGTKRTLTPATTTFPFLQRGEPILGPTSLLQQYHLELFMGKLSSCTHKSHIHCGNGVHSSDLMTIQVLKFSVTYYILFIKKCNFW